MRVLLFAAVLAFAMHMANAACLSPKAPNLVIRCVSSFSWITARYLSSTRCHLSGAGFKEFLNALPPNHELMLVTTGAQMNIRVEPTRDYLTVMESALSIQVMRNSGNALISSVEEVYARYLRSVERRFPVLVIVATEGPGHESRVSRTKV